MITRSRRILAALLVVCITGLGLPLPTHAGLISTERATANADRERVIGLLERAEVRNQLQSYGVEPAAVKARVDALADSEVEQLARHIDSLPAGGDALIGAIVFVFVLLLVTDLLGLTKVFPFTRAIR
jgi:hypothetical protein